MAALSVLTSEKTKKDISSSELSQRMAVIKRFKEMLKAQRDRFQAYLNALDKQRDVIQRGTTDDLLRHVELEEKIVSDIFSIQKVIDPLEKLYQITRTSSSTAASSARQGSRVQEQIDDSGAAEVSDLKQTLESLKAEAIIRSEQNRELLSKRMAELRAEIKNMKNTTYARRNFNSAPVPSLIDLKG